MAALALKAPVMDASFAMSQNSALVLYDSLVPKVEQHAYATWVKCKSCKLLRQKKGLDDLMLNQKQLA